MIEIALGSLLLTVIVLTLTATVLLARSILAPAHPATVTVNGATTIAAQTGDKLLGVLNDHGINIPSACAGAGTCGLCRLKVTGGGLAPLPTEAALLSKSDLRAGMHLACQVVVREDMSVEVAENLLAAESFECVVRSARPLTPLIRELVLELPEGVRPEIAAGAFIQVTAPPFALDYADLPVSEEHCAAWEQIRALTVSSDAPVSRAYSIANRPEDTAEGRVVLNIRLALPPPSVPEAQPGIVSSWLFTVKPGDLIAASGPFGDFRAQTGDREMVFIGGGVGMAPLRAIIFDQVERLGTDRKISYWYGARSKVELFYEEEFEALAARHTNFTWTVALSDPQPADHWAGSTGFVHTVAFERYLRDHQAPEACEYYLCGPPLMIQAVLAMLDDLGVDETSIFKDDFGV